MNFYEVSTHISLFGSISEIRESDLQNYVVLNTGTVDLLPFIRPGGKTVGMHESLRDPPQSAERRTISTYCKNHHEILSINTQNLPMH
jgi:hypothetical protein